MVEALDCGSREVGSNPAVPTRSLKNRNVETLLCIVTTGAFWWLPDEPTVYTRQWQNTNPVEMSTNNGLG